jgi:hypothetical protein
MDSKFFGYLRYCNIVIDHKFARLYFEVSAVCFSHGLTSFKLILSLTFNIVHFYYTTFNVKLFLYLKEKVTKRSKPTCCWIAGEYGSRIPQSPVVSARTPAWTQSYSLAENAEVFGRHSVLWGTLIVWRLFFWCADGTASPPRAYFIPAEFGEITVLYLSKTYWGLNKPVGILAVLSMYPARSARLPYALHDDKEP